MSERPLLFLDVDGVLNAFGNDAYPRYETEGGPCWVPTKTGERVGRLLEAFDPYWATAWLGGAHKVWSKLLAFDGDPWPWLDYRQHKLTEIVRVAGPRRWAWVDDDGLWEMRACGWTPEMVPGLVIVPDPKVGLTDEHVVELLAFAGGHG